MIEGPGSGSIPLTNGSAGSATLVPRYRFALINKYLIHILHYWADLSLLVDRHVHPDEPLVGEEVWALAAEAEGRVYLSQQRQQVSVVNQPSATLAVSTHIHCKKRFAIFPNQPSTTLAITVVRITVKKRFAIFPSPSRDVTYQTLPAGNNFIIPAHGESLVSDILSWGAGKSRTFFNSVSWTGEEKIKTENSLIRDLAKQNGLRGDSDIL